MNCSDNIYHKNQFGSTCKCECLNAVHVQFGTVTLLLTRPQCRDFHAYISEALEAESHVLEDPEDRCIFIPTRDNSLMFAVTFNELKQLGDLLNHTSLMLDVEEALNSD